VVVVGPANTVAPILKQAQAKGWKPLILTVFVCWDRRIDCGGGADAEGVVITQVVPPYYMTEQRSVALYRRALGGIFPPSGLISSASRDLWMPWCWSKASNGRGRI
jgi:hypothetical protein